MKETVARLLAAGTIKPEDFGLVELEVRRFGRCFPTEFDPCNHDADTCDMVMDVYQDGEPSRTGVPHCDMACPNMEDDGGDIEGIGGQYPGGGTFSYLTDDHELTDKVWERVRSL